MNVPEVRGPVHASTAGQESPSNIQPHMTARFRKDRSGSEALMLLKVAWVTRQLARLQGEKQRATENSSFRGKRDTRIEI
jgi:hypothetical protein